MADENDKEVDDIELGEPEPILDEEGNDTTNWKAEALKRHGLASRNKKDLDKVKAEFESYKTAHPEAPEPPKPQDKKDFDLAEKSYLLANGIKKELIPFVWEETQKSGKSIDEMLESEYFKEKLEEETTKLAVPKGTDRAGGQARDEVDYWVAKGQLPPNTPENRELRHKVRHAFEAKHSDGQKFSPNPIV